MMNIVRGRAFRTFAVLATSVSLFAGFGTQSALAAQSQVCGRGGAGYCLNDWGGAGATGDVIKMYNGGVTNDNFYVEEVNRCNGGDKVLSTAKGNSTNCPFATAGLDEMWWNHTIVQIVYANNTSKCVGQSGNQAVLAACADAVAGTGGGNGVIMVKDSGSSCDDGSTGTGFISRSASDPNSLSAWLTTGGNPGVAAGYELIIDGPQTPTTCWGGFSEFAP
jgi:hypothetical protein